MNRPSYQEAANDWKLWRQFVDPDGTLTASEDEFRSMSEMDKIAMQVRVFGQEPGSSGKTQS